MAVRSSFVDRYSLSIGSAVSAGPPDVGDKRRAARKIVMRTGMLARVETDGRLAPAPT